MITDIINVFTKMEEEKMTRYESAKEIYAKLGVDTDAAIAKCKEIPVSLHCWQGDDVTGFDHDGPLTGESRQQETIREKQELRKNC